MASALERCSCEWEKASGVAGFNSECHQAQLDLIRRYSSLNPRNGLRGYQCIRSFLGELSCRTGPGSEKVVPEKGQQ